MAKVTIASLAGARVYLDTNILIYCLEQHPLHFPVLQTLFHLFDSGAATAVTSELTLAECLAQPFAANDVTRQHLYQSAIAPRPDFEVVPVSRSILVRAAQLRSLPKLRLPDAIHLATALESSCSIFLSNDMSIPQTLGISQIILADLVA